MFSFEVLSPSFFSLSHPFPSSPFPPTKVDDLADGSLDVFRILQHQDPRDILEVEKAMITSSNNNARSRRGRRKQEGGKQALASLPSPSLPGEKDEREGERKRLPSLGMGMNWIQQLREEAEQAEGEYQRQQEQRAVTVRGGGGGRRGGGCSQAPSYEMSQIARLARSGSALFTHREPAGGGGVVKSPFKPHKGVAMMGEADWERRISSVMRGGVNRTRVTLPLSPPPYHLPPDEATQEDQEGEGEKPSPHAREQHHHRPPPPHWTSPWEARVTVPLCASPKSKHWRHPVM